MSRPGGVWFVQGTEELRVSSPAETTAHGGVNANLLAGDDRYDALSGNAVLNGIPVRVAAGSGLPA